MRRFIKISETVSNLHSRHNYMVEIALSDIYDVQRAVAPKVNQSYSSYVLHVVSWCFAFV